MASAWFGTEYLWYPACLQLTTISSTSYSRKTILFLVCPGIYYVAENHSKSPCDHRIDRIRSVHVSDWKSPLTHILLLDFMDCREATVTHLPLFGQIFMWTQNRWVDTAAPDVKAMPAHKHSASVNSVMAIQSSVVSISSAMLSPLARLIWNRLGSHSFSICTDYFHKENNKVL